MGFAALPAIYIAVCLTFSSTIIIVKLLSDKREIDSLHGRIAVGFLVVQDIAVILAMILLTSFNLEGAVASPARRSGCCWWAAPSCWAPPPRCAG